MSSADVALSRPFGRSGDHAKVIAFVRQVAKQSSQPELNLHIGDVAWRLNRSDQFDPSSAIHLWEHKTTKALLGMGWYTAAHHGVDILVANQMRTTDLEKRILQWADQKLRQIPFEKRGYAEIKIQVHDWDKQREQLLSKAGYRRDIFHYVWFQKQLDKPLEEPNLPNRFTIRSVTDDDIAERAELHNLAFFIDDVNQNSYKRVVTTEVYRPELDLVAIAPDGRLAAFVLGWVDPILGMGLFEPVGTHPDFRRLGLAKSLLLKGMVNMRAAGMRSAQVYTESPNLHAQKLYHSAGFKVAGKQFDWIKSR